MEDYKNFNAQKSGIRQGLSAVISKVSPRFLRRGLLYLFGLPAERDRPVEIKFMLEDQSGSLICDWHLSQLSLTTLPLAPPKVSLDGTVFDVIQPSMRLDDLVLAPNTRRDSGRILQESRDWERLKSSGLSPASCVLFCGPAGSGKSATAEAIASEMGVKLVRFSFENLSQILAEGSNDTIWRVVDFLSTGRSVVFVEGVIPVQGALDEVDLNVFREAVARMLHIFDSVKGRSLVILSSTSEAILHATHWQRFDEVLRFTVPGDQEIRLALTKWLSPLAYTEDQLDRLLDIADDLSFSSVGRLCLDVKRSCVLRSDNSVRDSDVDEARDRQNSRTRSFNFSSIKMIGSTDRIAPLYATLDR